MRKMVVTAGCVLAVTWAAGASAAVKQGDFYVSPLVGGYTFEGGKQHLKTNLLYGARLGYNATERIAVEGGMDYTRTSHSPTGKKIALFKPGFDLVYNMYPKSSLVPFLAVGYGLYQLDGPSVLVSKKARGAFDYGAGLKMFLNDSFALRADVRHIIAEAGSSQFHGKNVHNLSYTVGAYIPFGGTAPVAKPVAAPAPVVEAVQPKAAPAAPVIVPEPPKPAPKPAPAPPKDSDGDGVIDSLDKCPDTPAGVKVDSTGCPLDSDKDGVPDYLDKCPGTPAGTKVDANGCPPPVEAAQPKASAAAVKAAERFCSKPAVIAIQFDTNKADIKPKYESDLKILGIFLKEFPNAKGQISGHTDNVGSKEANMKLSKRRADSVKGYLTKNYGVAPERIETVGYGPTKPVADNKSAAGKAKNRRIETSFTCD